MRQLNVGLTPEQVAKRRNSVGASDANIIMSGDDARVLALWEQKTGRAEPEDLSRVLPVIMGSWSEELNRYWYELQTGRAVHDEGREVASDVQAWRTATLDGLTTTEAGDAAVFEAKHVSAFQSEDDVVQRYMPQLHHQMAVTHQAFAVLSIFFGTQKWVHYEVERHNEYMAALLSAEEAFWTAVRADEPPVHIESVETPMPDKLRDMDMSESNLWASMAADWLDNAGSAKKFDKAAKELKGLVERDVGLAFGHGVQIKRAKNGSLRITAQ